MLVNIERAHDYMQKYDLGALVATSAVNTSYFTGYDCWQFRSFREAMTIPGGPNTLSQSYGVITERDARPALITSTYMSTFPVDGGVELRPYGDFEEEALASTNSAMGATTPFRQRLSKQRSSPSKALLGLLAERGVSRGKIGVEMGNLSLETRVALKKLPRIEVLDSSELIRFIRMVKTPEEVTRLKKAARSTEDAILKSVGTAKPDSSMDVISGIFRTELARKGASLEHWTYNIDGLGLTDDPGQRLKSGAYVSHDVGSIYKLYYSDTGTTIVVGNQKQAIDLHRLLFRIVEENIDALKAGALPSVIMRSYAKAYRREGLKNVSYQLHGIGLETREHPVIAHSRFKKIADDVISSTVDIPLEEGMVMNIETPLDHPGKGSFQVERTFLIRNGSPEEITPKRDGDPLVVG